jgi:hypothetical protein
MDREVEEVMSKTFVVPSKYLILRKWPLKWRCWVGLLFYKVHSVRNVAFEMEEVMGDRWDFCSTK